MSPPPKDIATIAILGAKLDGAIVQIGELKGRFDTFQAGFIQKDVYNIRHEELVRQVGENTAEIRHLQRNQSHSVSWVWPFVTLVLGGVLVFLINFALTH